MSVIADEAMDSSAVSEEEVEEQSSPTQSYNKLAAAGEIIEGKRAKKAVERLDIQVKQKEKFKVEDGGGDKLGDIPRTNYLLTKIKPADLKPLHTILFDRPGKAAMIKKNVRLFNGFPFDMDSEQYTKKREKLLKNSHFTNSKLKVICGVLDLEKKGTHSDLIDRILTFLISPKNSGKRLPTKKKRRSKKKLSGDDVVSKTKRKGKPKPRNASASPKKSKAGSKSKAIVMDSSSDEDEEDDKAGASAGAEGSDNEEKLSEKEEEMSEKSEDEQSEDEEEEEEEEEEGDEDESPKTKAGRAKSASSKSAPAKRQRMPAKKKNGPPMKRAKQEPSGQSEADSDADEKPKTKKSAAKTKRADSSSSNRKNNTNAGKVAHTTSGADDSSDDEPLIKMVKKAPSEEELKETVQGLLKEANLEEMTMKQICQKVFDTYPDHDLTSKKDFIKNTVKSLIT